MLPFFLSAFAIFLLRQFFRGFPDDILNAARLDGMSEFEIVWRIVTPSALPAIAAFAIFSIVAHWNDLYWPLIVVADNRLAPPPLGMLLFADAETGSNYGALTAAATILTAPLVLAFMVAHRRFIQGITMTGVNSEAADYICKTPATHARHPAPAVVSCGGAAALAGQGPE